MHLQLGSRVRRHARLIGGVIGAAVLLTGGGALAATSRSQPQAAPSGVTLEQAEAFVSITPTRVLDTRQPGATEFGPGETRTLSFAGRVPAEATSVALALVSPQGATALGYFTMWPSGQPRPETSVVNPVPSYDLATSALLRLGSGQSIDIYNAFGQADMVVDLLGYFVPLADVDGIGGGSNFLTGSGAPSSGLGEDGDVYYDSAGKVFYGPKQNGNWGPGSSATGPTGAQGAVGPQGPAGSKILSGSVAPSAGTGVDGDLYLDTATGNLYGPKTGGAWGSPTSLVGPQGDPGTAGSRILSGAGAPDDLTDGVDGDFYFDTTNDTFYGPKTAGAWGAGTSVQGAQGPAGTMGPGLQVWQDAGLVTAVVLGGTDVDFPDGNVTSYGAGAPTYTNGDITINTAGTYRISYTYETTAGLLVSMRVTHNGAPVVSSVSGGALTVATYAGQALVTAAATDTISLQFFGLLGAATANHGSILIEKVA